MAAGSSLYKVVQKTGPNTTEVRLVRASERRIAINFVAAATITAEKATQDEIFELAKAGCKIEEARPENGELEV